MTVFTRSIAAILPVTALAVAAVQPALAQAPDPARTTVQTLSDGLIATMKAGKKAGFAGRVAIIGPVVDRSFDMPLLTRLAVGTVWTTTSAADRSALVAALRRLTVSQYADNFDSWSGQSFAVDPKVDARGTDRFVKTVLKQPKGDSVKIGYRLRQSAGQWRVIDVYYQDSISQLATRRADFESILAKGGAKALVAHLDALSGKAAR